LLLILALLLQAKVLLAFPVFPVPKQRTAASGRHFRPTSTAQPTTKPDLPSCNSLCPQLNGTRKPSRDGPLGRFHLRNRIRSLVRRWSTFVLRRRRRRNRRSKRAVPTVFDQSQEDKNGDDATFDFSSGVDEKSAFTDLENMDGIAEQEIVGIAPQRWAVAANTTNLSGVWKPIITPEFRKEYDDYLQKCGEGIIFRRAMLGAVGFLKEVVEQNDGGRELSIMGTTPIGGWKRVLIASGYNNSEHEQVVITTNTTAYEPIYSSFRDPDGDTVSVESWWQDNGRIHKSWLRGKPRVFGGEFESTRYLDGKNDELVCESVFHPPPDYNGDRFQPARMNWRFQRVK